MSMDPSETVLNDEDAAAIKQADDYIANRIVPMGWEVIDIGHTQSAIRRRQARSAIVRKGGFELVIVWDRGLQSFLTAMDLEGTRWGIFDPALYRTEETGAAMEIQAGG